MRIAAVAVISMCIFGASAETGNCDPEDSGSCKYTLTGTELVITGSGPMKDYGSSASNTAPWRNTTCSVTKVTIKSGITRIGSYAFYQCTNMTSATIQGSTVETIGMYAFSGCSSIVSFTIPNGVKTLENYSFSGCTSLNTTTFPTSLKRMDVGVFSNTGFTKFTFPSSMTEIPPFYCSACSKLKTCDIPEGITKVSEKAFWNCNALINATIPASVTDLHRTAFSRDTQRNIMKDIFVHKCNPNYADIDGVLFTKDKKTLILYPGYHSARYRIPEGVTDIGPYAFDFVTNNFWQINFSSTVTHIGESAFSNQGVSMDDLVIPANVVKIDREAFFNNGAKRVYYLGLHDPDPENKGAFLCPVRNSFYTLYLPIDYQDSAFSGRNVSVKGNSTFDSFRGKDNECYQAFYRASIKNFNMCGNYPPIVTSASGEFAMRPHVYETIYNNPYSCWRYACVNQTGLNQTSNRCYYNQICVDDRCVYPPKSSELTSSVSEESEECPGAKSTFSSQLNSGLRSTASYVMLALVMAFVLLI